MAVAMSHQQRRDRNNAVAGLSPADKHRLLMYALGYMPEIIDRWMADVRWQPPQAAPGS